MFLCRKHQLDPKINALHHCKTLISVRTNSIYLISYFQNLVERIVLLCRSYATEGNPSGLLRMKFTISIILHRYNAFRGLKLYIFENAKY